MCTLSIVPTTGGLRLVFNRDESRGRARGLPPRLVSRGGVHALMPLDPDSGGSWLAASDRGLVFAILNLNCGGAAAASARSRGEIIPGLIDCSTLDRVRDAVAQVPCAVYRPFSLVVASRSEILCVQSVCQQVSTARLDAPFMLTSSGLGDPVVERPRRKLFQRIMNGRGHWCEKQDRFHAHRWRYRPEISVEMSRVDACTVSRTIVEIDGRVLRMEYVSLAAPQQQVCTVSTAIQQAGLHH
jgi:hypothetical protein